MLRVICPITIASPASPLVEHVPHALTNVAPENADELNRVLDGFTLEILDEPRWICCALPTANLICVSTRVIEILWAQAYAVYVFYQRVVAGTLGGGPETAISNPDVLEALELYRWALNRFIDNAPSTWPDGRRRPELSPAQASDTHVAQDLALIGLGYLLLHEVAHIVLRHQPGMDSTWRLDQERDADEWAADWVLARGTITRQEIAKRSIGIALALSTLVSKGVYTGRFDGDTHLRHFDRLYNALSHRIPHAHDEAWAVVVGVLSLHFTNAGIAFPEGPFEDHAEAANAFFDLLADLHERERR